LLTAKADDRVTVERRLPAAIITLNLPDQRNPLSVALMGALRDELKGLASDDEVRVVVIRGAGKIFSSGHNLREMTDRALEEQREVFDVCTEMMQTVQQIPQPVIAQVHGVAAAAGCQLVATCDLAVAADSTLFLTPGVRIGLFCSTPMVALSRNILRKRAMEMLLLGELIDANEAAQYGLVNKAVPTDDVMEETLAYARRIVTKSPATVAIGKEAFYHQIELPLSDAYDYAVSVMVQNMLYSDAEEGIGAFLEKRKPEWKGC
jgi:enoyl-CoA hydratase/carnithine racemase